MSTSWEFAHNLAQVSTGVHPPWEPEVSIEPVEQGVYKLSVDRESIALTAQDLLDIMDWCLLHARELTSQATYAESIERRADQAGQSEHGHRSPGDALSID